MDQIRDGGWYDRVILRLKEREKELMCIYRVDEVLSQDHLDIEYLIRRLIEVIPAGWQHTTFCEVRIIFEGKVFRTQDFRETPWMQHADIVLDQNVAGRIDVAYTQNIEPEGRSPFLSEEQKLLRTIAESLGHHIFIRRLRATLDRFREQPPPEKDKRPEPILSPESDLHWIWRRQIAETLAKLMDFQRFGVRGVYLIGSVKEATAGPGSDIDLLIHHQGTDEQRKCLISWLDGWSLALAELSFLHYGYRLDSGMLDVHLITDADISQKTSFAVMIGSLENSARPLKVLGED
ncbi:MAG: nucleotidyltransferase domain-containing protein [Bacteroidales bacterium]|nr:nucleotidyltransferase domain-containing protein [Bacteroidales bacterium]